MITKPTVLVLGAGVSFSYGYPIGIDLIKDIFQGVSNTDWRKIYNACGVTNEQMYSMRSELLQSKRSSVDAFLEHRHEFLQAGKVAIALSLLSREDPDSLDDFDVRDKGIYHFVYNNLSTSWEEFKESKLTIITFNYDRSLETFLFSALKHSYNKSDVEVAEAIQRIPVIHVHGSLGPLPWQNSGGTDYYPLFRKGINSVEIMKRVRVASKNIVIVSEAQSQSKEFVLATNYIKGAERIYFLGFGYYRVNLERLSLSHLNYFDISLASLFSNIHQNGYRDSNFVVHQPEIIAAPSFKYYRGSALGLRQVVYEKAHTGNCG